jgi:hypothetical protein
MRPLTPLSLAILLAAAMAATPRTADCAAGARCSCKEVGESLEQKVAARLASADAVLLATVEDTVLVAPEGPRLARLRVERWWKGGETDTLTVMESPSTRVATSCDYPLRPGDTHVLFMYRLPSGSLKTSWCSGSVKRSDRTADEVLRYLGPGRTPGDSGAPGTT